MMDYIFIDFENVPVQGIPDHAGIKKIFLFAGEKQKFTFEVLTAVKKLGPKSEEIKLSGSGNNALDFHIAFYLGRQSEIDPKGSFRIVSKDKGFDPLVAHLVSKGIDCARIESLATKVVTKKDLRELIDDIGAHLLGLGEKVRPKKESKLKAYIKNRSHQEDAVVVQLFDGLRNGKYFDLDGGKVIYGKGPQIG